MSIGRTSPFLCLLVVACGSSLPTYSVSGTVNDIDPPDPSYPGKVLFAIDGFLYDENSTTGNFALSWSRDLQNKLSISVLATSVPAGKYSGSCYYVPMNHMGAIPEPFPPGPGEVDLLGSWSIGVFEGGGYSRVSWKPGQLAAPGGGGPTL